MSDGTLEKVFRSQLSQSSAQSHVPANTAPAKSRSNSKSSSLLSMEVDRLKQTAKNTNISIISSDSRVRIYLTSCHTYTYYISQLGFLSYSRPSMIYSPKIRVIACYSSSSQSPACDSQLELLSLTPRPVFRCQTIVMYIRHKTLKILYFW